MSVEEGYCPKCGKRKIMATIKADGTSYVFCKDCGWNNKALRILGEKIREKTYSQQEVENVGQREVAEALKKHDGSLKRLAQKHIEEQIWVKVNDVLTVLEDERQFGKYIDRLRTEMSAKIESELKLHGISQNNEFVIVDKKQGKFVVVSKQVLSELAELLKKVDDILTILTQQNTKLSILKDVEKWKNQLEKKFAELPMLESKI